MNTIAKKTLKTILVLMVLCCSVLYAEPVKKFKFTAVTRSEQVDIIIDDSTQQLIHQAPDRTVVYSILDYDYTVSDEGEKIFKAVVVDNVYNTAYDVLLFVSKKFADIRIGKKKRLTFNTVRECTVVPLD